MNGNQPELKVCHCNACAGRLEFESSNAGEIIDCPLCGAQTVLFHPGIPPPLPPETIWFGPQASMVEIRLTSGVSMAIHAVRLYSEIELNALAAEKANAAQLLEGVSSPFVPWGSIEWVVFAAMLNRTLETKFSRKAADQGMALIREIGRKEQLMRQDLRFFPVGQIQDISDPTPSLWRVPPRAGVPCGFVHSGDEFLSVKTKCDTIHSVRWSAVEAYKYQANG
jgi:hypothetical protein